MGFFSSKIDSINKVEVGQKITFIDHVGDKLKLTVLYFDSDDYIFCSVEMKRKDIYSETTLSANDFKKGNVLKGW